MKIIGAVSYLNVDMKHKLTPLMASCLICLCMASCHGKFLHVVMTVMGHGGIVVRASDL